MNNIRPMKKPPNTEEQTPTPLADMLRNLCGAVKNGLPNAVAVEARFGDRLVLVVDFRDRADQDAAVVLIRSGLIPMFKGAQVGVGERPAGKLVYRLMVEMQA